VLLKDGCFPTKLKPSVIIPIIKPGREDYNVASNYRGIIIINMGGKLLEKLMLDRILFHIQSNDLFKGNQYGFIPQNGTFDEEM